MRISTSQVYATSLQYINNSLTNLTELQEKSASMKKVNKPSDDPSAMGEILKLRADDSRNSQYQDNMSTAEGYLSLADDVLSSVSEVVINVSELAAQNSTGTYSLSQMQGNAVALEQNLEQLVALANTEYTGNAIFGGQSTDTAPYTLGLGVTLDDETLDAEDVLSVEGETDAVVCVLFDDSGEIGGLSDLTYRYSVDGGTTWNTAVLSAGDSVLNFTEENVQMELQSGVNVTATEGADQGTTIYVRPTVYYQGDHEQMKIQIDDDSSMGVTMDGTDIFGGVDSSGETVPLDMNLFEVMGNLIAYSQTGDHEGVASCLENLTSSHSNIESGAARIGASENRLTLAQDANALYDENIMTSISGLEDADMAEISTELTKQELIYESVLSTCSKVMSMSLADYL